MCFKITSNKPNPAVKAYKIVEEDRDTPIRQGYGYKYSDGASVPALREPDTQFIRRIGSQSQAGIYVYLDKRQAKRLIADDREEGHILVEVEVNPAHFIAEGIESRDRYSQSRNYWVPIGLKVATYKYVKVVGEVT